MPSSFRALLQKLTPKNRLTKAKQQGVAQGTAIYIMMRWTDRLIGFVSLLILARLLSPSDFGLVAMATVMAAILEAFVDFGMSAEIIRRKDLTDDYYHSIWTIQFLQRAGIAVVLALLSWPIALYYEEPRMLPIVLVLALSMLVNAFDNMSAMLFQRAMSFRMEFMQFFSKRLLSFFLTVGLAYWLQSYWALLIGTLFSRGMTVLMSYVFYPVLPKFHLKHVSEIIGFSMWMFAKNLAAQLFNRYELFILAKVNPSAVVGSYSIGKELSALPTTELLSPMSRALFPAIAQCASTSEAVSLYHRSMALQALLVLPAGIGLMFVAENLVHVVLGSNWLAAAPLMAVMALSNCVFALCYTANYYLVFKGAVRSQFALFAGLLALVFLLLYLAPRQYAQYTTWVTSDWPMLLAFSKLLVDCLYSVGTILQVSFYYREISLGRQLLSLWRPTIAALGMGACLYWFQVVTHAHLSWQPWLTLIFQVLVGGASYTALLLILWLLCGRPDGGERWILSQLKK